MRVLFAMASSVLLLGTGLSAQVQTTGSTGDWRAVERLRPGQGLRLTIDDDPAVERVFVAADSAELVVLDSAAVPSPTARRSLLRVVEQHPERLARLGPGDTLVLDNGVQIAAGALMLKERRLTSTDVVLARYPRASVAEVGVGRINVPRIAVTALSSLGGYFGGFILGLALEGSHDVVAVTSQACAVVAGFVAYKLARIPLPFKIVYRRT